MVEEGVLYMWKVLNVTMLQSYNVTKCTSPSILLTHFHKTFIFCPFSARAALPLRKTTNDTVKAMQ